MDKGTVDTAAMAARIGVTPRRAQQLVDEGVLIRNPDGRFEADVNARRYRIFRDHDVDAVCRALQAVAEELDECFDRLRAARTAAAREAATKETGPLIGRFDAVLRLVGALSPPEARPLIARCSSRDVAEAFAVFMAEAGLILIAEQ